MQVKFRYKDGFTKTCSSKEAELLGKMGRGNIVTETRAPEVEPKPAKRKKVVTDEIA